MSNPITTDYIVSVHYTFAATEVDEAELMLQQLRAASRAEDGVIAFEIVRSRATWNEYLLWEHYRDRAAFDAHATTEYYERLVVNGIRKLALRREAENWIPI